MLARASTGYQWFLSGYSMEQPYISVRVISFPLTKRYLRLRYLPIKSNASYGQQSVSEAISGMVSR